MNLMVPLEEITSLFVYRGHSILIPCPRVQHGNVCMKATSCNRAVASSTGAVLAGGEDEGAAQPGEGVAVRKRGGRVLRLRQDVSHFFETYSPQPGTDFNNNNHRPNTKHKASCAARKMSRAKTDQGIAGSGPSQSIKFFFLQESDASLRTWMQPRTAHPCTTSAACPRCPRTSSRWGPGPSWTTAANVLPFCWPTSFFGPSKKLVSFMLKFHLAGCCAKRRIGNCVQATSSTKQNPTEIMRAHSVFATMALAMQGTCTHACT